MFLVHSGDSAKASSALQALDTSMPDQDPGFVALFCPATARGTMEKSVSKRRKQHFAVESVLTDSFNLRPLFRSQNSLVLYTWHSQGTTTPSHACPSGSRCCSQSAEGPLRFFLKNFSLPNRILSSWTSLLVR